MWKRVSRMRSHPFASLVFSKILRQPKQKTVPLNPIFSGFQTRHSHYFILSLFESIFHSNLEAPTTQRRPDTRFFVCVHEMSSRYSLVTPAASRLYPQIDMHCIHGSTTQVWIQRLACSFEQGTCRIQAGHVRPCDHATMRPCDLEFHKAVYWSRNIDTDTGEWAYGLQ